MAHKFWDDVVYNNTDIAKIGGVSTKLLNQLEKDFLNGINWNLYKAGKITNEEFQDIVETITGIKYNAIVGMYNKHSRSFVRKKMSDKKMSDKKMSDKKMSDKKMSDKKMSDKKMSDKKMSDKKMSDKKCLTKKCLTKKCLTKINHLS